MRKLLVPVLMTLSGCVTPTGPGPEEPTKPPTGEPDPCAMVSEVQKLQYKECAARDAAGTCVRWDKGQYDQQMPVTKAIAHEAHYLVQGLDPNPVPSVTHLITPHMARTCSRLLRGEWAHFYGPLEPGCLEVYKGGGATQWTPAEGGGIGHGSTGKLYPSVECEASSMNMYWANGAAPKPGTRYVVKNPKNGRAFILCGGYEAGPGSRDKSGGVVTEVLYWLQGKHGLLVTLGKAADQTLPYGPVDCAK